MRDATMVWLIRRYTVAHRAEYMHEISHMAFEFSPDAGRALRFRSKGEAERFGSNVLCCGFHAAEVPLRELVRLADDRSLAGEVEDMDTLA